MTLVFTLLPVDKVQTVSSLMKLHLVL